MDRIDNSVPRVNVWHYEALPISDPRDRIAYYMHKLMIDSYTPLNIELALAIIWRSLGKVTSEQGYIIALLPPPLLSQKQGYDKGRISLHTHPI